MPEQLSYLFAEAQSWWLAEESGPGLLFAVRMLSAALGLFAAWSWVMLARTPIVDSAWEDCHRRRFGAVCRAVALSLGLACGYFVAGGVFEIERTSSPHRLIVGNVAWATLFLALSLMAIFMRFMFTRKVVVKAQRIQARQERA